MVDSLRPYKLSEALIWLKENKAIPLAGGTDLMVRNRSYSGTSSKIKGPVLFTDAIEEMRSIKVEKDFVEIGGAVLLSELEIHKNIPELLRMSISQLAAPALRNRATLAGNICNASPAGDTLPPLVVYDAQLVLSSVSNIRTVSLDQFITGPGRTVLAEDELVTAIRIPLSGKEQIYYRKVGTRAANALSKLSIAAFSRFENNKIADCRIALGAVAPLIVRNRECEKMINGKTPDQIDIKKILQAYEPLIVPIDDQRSTAEYRKNVALNLIGDFLEKL